MDAYILKKGKPNHSKTNKRTRNKLIRERSIQNQQRTQTQKHLTEEAFLYSLAKTKLV